MGVKTGGRRERHRSTLPCLQPFVHRRLSRVTGVWEGHFKIHLKNEEIMSISKELLIKKAHEGYTVCYIDECPLRSQCLRWLVGQHVPDTYSSYRCVNPHFEGVATTKCPMCRIDQKVRYAKGMTHTFTSDMPKRVEPAVRQGVIGLTNRTYYLSIAMVRVSFHHSCKRLSATCSVKTDGQPMCSSTATSRTTIGRDGWLTTQVCESLKLDLQNRPAFLIQHGIG